MIKVKKIENGHERLMQFSEFDWKRIMNIKEAGVRWELVGENKVEDKVNDYSELNQELDSIQRFEMAVKDGIIVKKPGGWYFFGDNSLGRFNDAIIAFEKL